MRRSLLSAAVVLSFLAPLLAGKVKTWHHHSKDHFDGAQRNNVVLSSDGAVQLSRRLKPLIAGIDKLQAQHVWAVVEDRSGNLYVATGNQGRIYKITAQNKVIVVHESKDSQVLCLAKAPDGTIYAGTGPIGTLVRIDPQGNVKLIADKLNAYVWSLAVDRQGKGVYAGTGPDGRIYQFTPDGDKRVFCQTKQDHVLCVALGEKGELYAGTDKQGLTYRIDRHGKPFVLYQAKQLEIRALLPTANGLFVGTSAPTDRKLSQFFSPAGGSQFAANRPAADGPIRVTSFKPNEKAEGASPKSESSSEKESKSKGKSTDAPSSPGTGENSIYHVRPDGTVREVFRQKGLILCLMQRNGMLYAGTGMEGQIFEVSQESKKHCEIARLDHGQILCACQRRDGSLVVGAGDPGQLYVLNEERAPKGTLVSEVMDAKIISKWGALHWEADAPEGCRVTVAVRTGNVKEPDDTWSDWSQEQDDPEKATITAPTARFLQYRITLTTTDPNETPTLRGITLRYRTTNQAPEITKLEVPNLNADDLDNPKKLKLKWTAADANEDDVVYHLYARKEGWKNWILLEEDLDKTSYDWSTTAMPTGKYRVKVVASDRPDNPEAEALAGSRISAPFVISHEPPSVSVKVVGIQGNRVELQALGSSRWVRLTSASFAVNGKKWINVFPTDTLFDSKSEKLQFKTPALKPGTYVVVVKMKDAAGNTGSGDVVLTVKEK